VIASADEYPAPGESVVGAPPPIDPAAERAPAVVAVADDSAAIAPTAGSHVDRRRIGAVAVVALLLVVFARSLRR